MESLWEFLESSTIHGFSYISGSKAKVAKIFWICVVLTGFATAAVLINSSFASWDKSPVMSSTETKLLSSARFPKVTVCPPEGTNTVLNHDLIKIENLTIDTETRDDLILNSEIFVEEEHHHNFIEDKRSLTTIENIIDIYKGKSRFSLPLDEFGQYNYRFKTFAKSGSMRTPWLQQEFSAARYIKKANYIYTIQISNIEQDDLKSHVRLDESTTEILEYKNENTTADFSGSPLDTFDKNHELNRTLVIQMDIDLKEDGGGKEWVSVYVDNQFGKIKFEKIGNYKLEF